MLLYSSLNRAIYSEKNNNKTIIYAISLLQKFIFIRKECLYVFQDWNSTLSYGGWHPNFLKIMLATQPDLFSYAECATACGEKMNSYKNECNKRRIYSPSLKLGTKLKDCYSSSFFFKLTIYHNLHCFQSWILSK